MRRWKCGSVEKQQNEFIGNKCVFILRFQSEIWNDVAMKLLFSCINEERKYDFSVKIVQDSNEKFSRRWNCGAPPGLQSISILSIFNFFYVNFVKKKYFEKLRSVTKVKVWGSPWTAIYGKPGKAFQVNIWHLSHLNFRYLL